MTASEPRRILVDHLGNKGIGDIVCETAYYPALKRRYPDATLASRGSRQIALGHPLIDAFDETSPDTAFDLVIRQASMRPIAARLPEALLAGDSIFEVFLAEQGFPKQEAPPELFVLPAEAEASGLLDHGNGPLLVAYSVDSKEPSRRWGTERFRAIAAHLRDVHGATLIELGSGLTAGHMGLGLDLVGKTDTRQAMAILSMADLFLGNNGGLTHLAGGVGTPCLVPWGASQPYEAYCYEEVSVALVTDPICQNCGWNGEVLPGCLEVDVHSGRTPCMTDIDVEAMREAADELVAYIRTHRPELRGERLSRRARARDTRQLHRFDRPRGIQTFTHLHLHVGGRGNWHEEHRLDQFSRLQRIVAFPDWSDEEGWRSLLDGYLTLASPDSDWLLELTAHPLPAPEIQRLIDRHLARHGRANVPKILVYIGALSESERRDLVEGSRFYVPLGSTYDPPEFARGSHPGVGLRHLLSDSGPSQ